MRRDFTWILIAYAVALLVALAVGAAVGWRHPLAVALAADVAATLAVFAFSRAFDNSSFYDAYWSVAPPLLATYFWAVADPAASGGRQAVVFALVCWWATRLTWNWARGWGGLGHEDWRYVDLRASTGRAYWLVSLVGLHLMPTVQVFLGCLSLYPALAVGTRPFGALDAVALLVSGGAIALEARADSELLRFRRSQPPPEAILASGVWSWSRHPNYFGEMGFWWGLWLFALAAAPGWWWTVIGPLAIALMFRFASLPLIETRMLRRRPAFAEHQRRVSMVIPWPPRA
jgi:steroid 5-alpha reductase family enzyme